MLLTGPRISNDTGTIERCGTETNDGFRIAEKDPRYAARVMWMWRPGKAGYQFQIGRYRARPGDAGGSPDSSWGIPESDPDMRKKEDNMPVVLAKQQKGKNGLGKIYRR